MNGDYGCARPINNPDGNNGRPDLAFDFPISFYTTLVQRKALHARSASLGISTSELLRRLVGADLKAGGAKPPPAQ